MVGQQDAPHGLFELANVAGPRVVRAEVFFQGFFNDLGHLRGLFAEDAAKEVVDQDAQLCRLLLEPLLQGGDLDNVRAEAVEKIVPERSFLAEFFQRAVGRGDYPAMEMAGFTAAHRRKASLLKHLQQLDLNRDGQLADFIEEDGTVGTAS